MGSRSKNITQLDWAYIAGFFDGDGSLIVQIKNRRDTTLGWRIMFTICFYQDATHKKPLQWMHKMFDIGYISDRNDGITELRINGYSQVKRILEGMQPHIRFKQKQVAYALTMLNVLENKKFSTLSIDIRKQLAIQFNEIRKANYKSKHKYSPEEAIVLLTR